MKRKKVYRVVAGLVAMVFVKELPAMIRYYRMTRM
jgi:hypothetical protein